MPESEPTWTLQNELEKRRSVHSFERITLEEFAQRFELAAVSMALNTARRRFLTAWSLGPTDQTICLLSNNKVLRYPEGDQIPEVNRGLSIGGKLITGEAVCHHCQNFLNCQLTGQRAVFKLNL